MPPVPAVCPLQSLRAARWRLIRQSLNIYSHCSPVNSATLGCSSEVPPLLVGGSISSHYTTQAAKWPHKANVIRCQKLHLRRGAKTATNLGRLLHSVRKLVMFTFKGQLILKCPFGVFKSSKKPTKISPVFLP